MAPPASSPWPTVLVVEDSRELATLYTGWLSAEYDVKVAHTGARAMELLDESIDAVLLDRRIPDVSGNEILEEIRNRALPCRVSMITAVAPDFDIVEMGFDDYLTKPVFEDDLIDVASRLLQRRAYDETENEFYALARKKAVLEDEKSDGELVASAEYARLVDRLQAVRRQLDEVSDALAEDHIGAMLRDLDEPPRIE